MVGTVASGSVVWTVIWNVINHLESIPFVKHFIKKEKIFDWVNRNKVLSLTTTEVMNLSVHGITSPLGPAMAFGGTLVNIVAIFGWIPLRQKRKNKADASGIILSV